MTRTHRFRRTLFLAGIALLLFGRWQVLADEDWYSVQAGDSIGSIAGLFGITEQALIDRNNMSAGERLVRGQILRIPIPEESPATHLVQAEDSLRSIAALYGITVEALVAENNIFLESHLIPGQTLFVPVAAEDDFIETHTVQAGETLQKIGIKYGIEWQVLAAVNNIVNPNRVYVGQVLVVPSAAEIAALPRPTSTPRPVPVQQQTLQRIYIAQSGDTLERIAQRYAVPLDALRAINQIRGESHVYGGDILLIPPGNIASPQGYPTPAAGERQHVVRYGETLGTIAASYGIDMWDIAAANGILNPHLVYVGQVLIIR